jgi:spore coat polysaccharide biosynthesis protein SpsF
MGSQRFPGKVVKPLCGETILWHIIERVKHAMTVDEIIVATTDQPADEAVVSECKKIDIPVFRGDEYDVLDRYYMASQLVKSDHICRVTADNPMIEPRFIDMAKARMEFSDEEYLSIDGCPLGTGIELFTKKALWKAAKQAVEHYQREHVTPYIRENGHLFLSGSVRVPLQFYHPDIRLTVDTPEDFMLLDHIYGVLYKQGSILRLEDVLKMLLSDPELLAVNRHVKQRSAVSF